MNHHTFFTSESITEGHPDKLCDQIADTILDELLRQDPDSRCACEVTAEPKGVHIMGEITTKAHVDYARCARDVIRDVGYTDPDYGFTDQCDVTVSLHEQSPDISQGVNAAAEGDGTLGAGDQGMMFGYACRETEQFMPLAIQLANELTMALAMLRKNGTLPYLRPDGKSQVTVEYVDGKPLRVDTVVIAAQHDPDVPIETLRADLKKKLINYVIPGELLDEKTKIYINATGRFVLGGPAADTGLTGRKIIADTYGGYARHGGGSFSGKDPTKVDRTAAYMSRYVAHQIVEAGVADRCEIQLSYAIGRAQPVSIHVDTFGTGKISDSLLQDWVMRNVDFRPSAMVKRLHLKNPIYRYTAAYGHFGRASFPWEWSDSTMIAALQMLI